MKLKLDGVVTFATTGLFCVFIAWGIPVVAQDGESEEIAPIEVTVPIDAIPEKAKTTNQPTIPVEQLKLLLKPLTVEQLQHEAAAWQMVLMHKAEEISLAELAVMKHKADSRLIKKENLVIRATNLETEQGKVIERFTAVLDEIDAKGGDTTAYRTYIGAISGVGFNISNTDGLGLRLVTWLKSEQGGIRLGFSILKFASILVASVIISPRLSKLVNQILQRVGNLSSLFREFLVMGVKRGTLVVGLLLALASIGVDLAPVLAIVGGASFVLAFALQSNLGNFASGLMLLVNKPFDVGDEVKVSGYWAFVDSISLASTRLRDFNGSIITVPNNTVWESEIINFTHSPKRKMRFSLTLGFEENLDPIEKMWFEITAHHPKILNNPAPETFPFHSPGDDSITIGLWAWSTTEDYWEVYSDALRLLQKRLPEIGVELDMQDIRVHQVQTNNLSLLKSYQEV